MSPRCPRQAAQPATDWRPSCGHTGPSSSLRRHARARAEPPSGQLQHLAIPTPPCAADHEPGTLGARPPPWQHSSRPTASSSTHAAARDPEHRTATHQVPYLRSSDRRSAPGPRPAAPSEPGCSSACPGTAHRRRHRRARHGATAGQDQEPTPGHPPGDQPAHPIAAQPAPAPAPHRGNGPCMLPSASPVHQGGAAKRRRGPGRQRLPPALGAPVGARPALAAGASADQPANRNDRKGRGCEAHAPIGQSLTRTQIVFRRPLPSGSG